MNVLIISKCVKRRNVIEDYIIKYLETRKDCDDYMLNDMLEDLYHFNNKVITAIETYIVKIKEKNDLEKFGIKDKE